MSRDKIFSLYREFVNKYPQLKDTAYIALIAALNMYDNNILPDTVEDRLTSGLNLLLLIDTKEQLNG